MTIKYNEDKALLKIITDGGIKKYHPIPIVRYWQFMALRKEGAYGAAWKAIERYRTYDDFMEG